MHPGKLYCRVHTSVIYILSQASNFAFFAAFQTYLSAAVYNRPCIMKCEMSVIQFCAVQCYFK